MEASNRFLACTVALITSALAVGQFPETAQFDAAQLEQIVAPIALYPDSLLAHVLMAATYPIEVIDADRFVRANPTLGGESIRSAVADRNWDPSVKALVGMPDLLKMMSENLDWTRDLGDAFLGQKAELLDAVQRLRTRARSEGTLTTTPQQAVKVKDSGITVIESASPDVIYVPTYSPCAVYGATWTYPYWYYPDFYSPGYWPYGYGWGIGFSAGFNWGGWLWGGLSWGWGVSDLWLWGPRYDYFNHYWHHRDAGHHDDGHHDGGGGHGGGGHDGNGGHGGGGGHDGGQADQGKGWSRWDHSPEHRSGVGYRDSSTARKFGGSSNSFVPRMQSRGYAPATEKGRTAPQSPGGRRVEPSQGHQNPSRSLSGARNPGLDNKSIDRGMRSRGVSPSGGGRGVSPNRGGGGGGGGGHGGGSFQGGRGGKGH